jgi:tetratricopeptide (TPR) repeat protein
LSQPPPSLALPRRALWLSAAGLFIVTAAAYHNSFDVPFVFDDLPAIAQNPTIRHLDSLGTVLFPELDGGFTVSGRPLVNLSLAVNYSAGGLGVAGYHVFNALVHALAGLCLFGVLRRTFLRPALASRFGADALPLALVTAAIWLIHPLQTESVTYVVQRAETLMGLFYLLTLYTFIRGVDTARPAGWFTLSVVACLCGMASKEVMATAPLMVLLYDRTFVAGSFAGAWRQRWRYYLGLASNWLLLAALVSRTGGRGGTAGFGTDVTAWHYLLTQARAVVHYFWLALWPDPLVFDYGTATVAGLSEVWWQFLLLIAAMVGTVMALRRRSAGGFLAAWFFVILAPSSSVVPIASQTMAEHRMYLSLAAVVVAGIAGLHALTGRRNVVLLVGAALALLCCGLTVRRNADYQSDLHLWAVTVAQQPENGRAHNNLGKAVLGTGRPVAALEHFEAAARLQPLVPEPHYNLGLALARLSRPAEAISRYEEALRLQPGYAAAHTNLANVLLNTGRLPEAEVHYVEAVRLEPRSAEARSNLANLRLEQGRNAEAIQLGEAAVALDPDYPEACYNLGNARAQSGQPAAALGQFEAAVRLRPDFAEAYNNLGNVLVELDRLPEAIAAYGRAAQLKGDYADPRRNLAMVLIHLGRGAEAIPPLQALVQLRPDDREARATLARLEATGRP